MAAIWSQKDLDTLKQVIWLCKEESWREAHKDRGGSSRSYDRLNVLDQQAHSNALLQIKWEALIARDFISSREERIVKHLQWKCAELPRHFLLIKNNFYKQKLWLLKILLFTK